MRINVVRPENNVVNVVGRKRVRDRKELIRRSLEGEGFHVGTYTNKHTIYIDTNSNRGEAGTTSHNTSPARENDRTTYDINDKTPATLETDEEILDRIASEQLDAHLADEDQYLRERRDEESEARRIGESVRESWS